MSERLMSEQVVEQSRRLVSEIRRARRDIDAAYAAMRIVRCDLVKLDDDRERRFVRGRRRALARLVPRSRELLASRWLWAEALVVGGAVALAAVAAPAAGSGSSIRWVFVLVTLLGLVAVVHESGVFTSGRRKRKKKKKKKEKRARAGADASFHRALGSVSGEFFRLAAPHDKPIGRSLSHVGGSTKRSFSMMSTLLAAQAELIHRTGWIAPAGTSEAVTVGLMRRLVRLQTEDLRVYDIGLRESRSLTPHAMDDVIAHARSLGALAIRMPSRYDAESSILWLIDAAAFGQLSVVEHTTMMVPVTVSITTVDDHALTSVTLQAVVAEAVNADRLHEWLQRPNSILGGAAPARVLTPQTSAAIEDVWAAVARYDVFAPSAATTSLSARQAEALRQTAAEFDLDEEEVASLRLRAERALASGVHRLPLATVEQWLHFRDHRDDA
jgi:hypothetical protein